MPADARSAAPRALVGSACALVAAALVWVGRTLTPRPPALADEVGRRLPETGVSNPVTGVLLDFRSYDTLLEVGVLVLALTAVWALRRVAAEDEEGAGRRRTGRSRPRKERRRPRTGQASGQGRGAPPVDTVDPAAPGPLLTALVRTVVPVAVVVAAYLWWVGSHAPGGAFQAGAILGAGGVLLVLSGALPEARLLERRARVWGVVGLLAFVAVGASAWAGGRAFLDHPDGFEGALIVLLEGVLTLSIAAVLAALFADSYSGRRREGDPGEGREEGRAGPPDRGDAP